MAGRSIMKILMLGFAIWLIQGTVQGQHTSLKIIDAYSDINSVQDLLKPFRGKPVFIDMWATWCEPCLKEFEYNGTLHDFLDKKNIEEIYISLDSNDLDKEWRKIMMDKNLYGYHVRANKNLRDALSMMIWHVTGDFYSIPHYLLFNKRGEVLDKDLPPPSSGLKLYDKMESVLR